jgi:hypothetical protein
MGKAHVWSWEDILHLPEMEQPEIIGGKPFARVAARTSHGRIVGQLAKPIGRADGPDLRCRRLRDASVRSGRCACRGQRRCQANASRAPHLKLEPLRTVGWGYRPLRRARLRHFPLQSSDRAFDRLPALPRFRGALTHLEDAVEVLVHDEVRRGDDERDFHGHS